jgi:hypothetical protein
MKETCRESLVVSSPAGFFHPTDFAYCWRRVSKATGLRKNPLCLLALGFFLGPVCGFS